MATIYVTNASELSTAMGTAQANDTILLADGDYGDLDIAVWRNIASNVTFQAENQWGAVFGGFVVNPGGYVDSLTFDGLKITAKLTFWGPNLTLQNSLSTSWVEAKSTSNASFINNYGH